MRTYRIDDRDFVPTDIITPQGKYFERLNGTASTVEEVLERHRPEDKPHRNKILMLFQEYNPAKIHWTRQVGAKFYTSEIEEEAILHIGDYNITEKIFHALKGSKTADADALAISYWEGDMSENPIREIFVNEAPVESIISNSEAQRKNEKCVRQGLTDMINPTIPRLL
jgi:hypothetical protein